jgi:sugar-specific transcriptional regulator TrmB
MIETILQDIGLNGKEIRVFLATLEHGEQPASMISKQVQMPRNTTRFILDRLAEKGLVKTTLRANAQLYTAEEPQNLIYVLEKKRVDETSAIDKRIEALKEVMAELETHFGPDSTKPRVTFYEGDEGLVKVYEDTLTSTETLRSFASFDSLLGILPDYFKSYFERRTKKGIRIRSIHPDTPAARENIRNDNKVARESRLVPADQYSFSPEIQIYDGKLSITSLKEKLGIIIESREIYDAMAVAFELAWKEATRLDQRKKKG